MVQHVKVASRARNVLPQYPTPLDYPAMRNSVATIPTRIARDPDMTAYTLQLLLELSSAGASEQWVSLPSQQFLAGLLHCSKDSIRRSLVRLVDGGYVTVLREKSNRRIVKISLPNLMYDME